MIGKMFSVWTLICPFCIVMFYESVKLLFSSCEQTKYQLNINDSMTNNFNLHSQITVMTFTTFLIYAGAAAIALLFLYSTKNYLISLIAGFISFCAFYFSFSTDDFEWNIHFILNLLKESAIIYSISFAISVIVYKIMPAKKNRVAWKKALCQNIFNCCCL